MADNKYGVITEQGYPVGHQFGFQPITEEEKKVIDEDLKKTKNDDEEE